MVLVESLIGLTPHQFNMFPSSTCEPNYQALINGLASPIQKHQTFLILTKIQSLMVLLELLLLSYIYILVVLYVFVFSIENFSLVCVHMKNNSLEKKQYIYCFFSRELFFICTHTREKFSIEKTKTYSTTNIYIYDNRRSSKRTINDCIFVSIRNV